MSLYGSDDAAAGTQLYAVGESSDGEQQRQQAQQGGAGPAQPDPGQALIQSIEAVAAPEGLVAQALPLDPSQSKLPLGWAIVGTCIAAILIASHFDKGASRE